MGFWNRKKKEVLPNPMALWVSDRVAEVRARWASAMAKLAARFSLQQQKATAILFCLFAGGYCVFLILQGVTGGSSGITVSVRKISTATAPKEHSHNKNTFENERDHVVTLRKLMDSLQQDPTGRAKYDSIRTFRPGLLDTLDFLEQYYRN